MPSYGVAFPKGWKVYVNQPLQRVSGCNKAEGPCTGNGGGFPLPGVVFLFLMPAENVPGQRYTTLEEIVASAPSSSVPNPEVKEVSLPGSSPTDAEKRCLVSRRLLPGKVWDEVYGLRIKERLFRVWVQYNDDRKEAAYRAAVLEILSSISVSSAR
jgi:hypothetical protein